MHCSLHKQTYINRGVYSGISPPPQGGEKKSKNQKQGREIKGKERGNENEEEQKKEKKGKL